MFTVTWISSAREKYTDNVIVVCKQGFSLMLMPERNIVPMGSHKYAWLYSILVICAGTLYEFWSCVGVFACGVITESLRLSLCVNNVLRFEALKVIESFCL